MRFGEIKTELYAASAKLSELVRQLALAGFAVIWVFKVGTTVQFVPPYLYPSAILFAIALMADLIQYTIQTWQWRREAHRADVLASNAVAANSALDRDQVDIPVPRSIHKAADKSFVVKWFSVVLGYAWLTGSLIWLLSCGGATDVGKPQTSQLPTQSSGSLRPSGPTRARLDTARPPKADSTGTIKASQSPTGSIKNVP